MRIKDFKFFEKEKEPLFQFRNSQMIATQLVEHIYNTGEFRNLSEVSPHQTREGVYRINDFSIRDEEGLIKIESKVLFKPTNSIFDIVLNVEFTDYLI